MMEEVNEFDFENRILSNEYDSANDGDVENYLRPKTLNEYIGQEKAKSNLKVYIESAKLRQEPLDHVLLYGLQVLVKLPFLLLLPMKWV